MTSPTQQKTNIMLALDRMFDEACEEGSEYGSYFAGYTGIYFDKATGHLRLERTDGETLSRLTFTIVAHKGKLNLPIPVPDGKPPFPCPNCGSENMSTVDDVLAFRAIHRCDTDPSDDNVAGVLITDAADDYSDGDNTRLCCHDCGLDFAIPANFAVEWEE
jgi:hypothetical protein